MRHPRLPPKKNKDLVNESIPFDNLVVIDENKKQLGVLSKIQALKLAEEKKLDLLCINPNAKIPICKILNYDQYRFKQQKNVKNTRKKNPKLKEKEIRFSASIDMNDLKIKVNNCRKFLEKNKKVKVTMRLRGREKYVEKYGFDKINLFVDMVKDIAKISKRPKLENNTYNMLLEALDKKSEKKGSEK